MRLARVRSALGAALCAWLGATGPLAAADVCMELEAQLVALDRGGARHDSRDYNRYAEAVHRQRSELDRAARQARRAGCVGGFLFFGDRSHPQCGPLMATIDRMEANLARLEARRNDSAFDPAAASRQRNRVLAALDANGCGAGLRPPPRPGLFSSLSAPPWRFREGEGYLGETYSGEGRSRFDDRDQFGAGTYRTLCVRSCDGYYFPISFSTIASQFARDEATCRRMCPAAEVALYTYRNPGEEPEAMVSLAGQPYASLASAFAYRDRFDPGCTCGRPEGVAASPIPSPPAISAAAPEPAVPRPLARPAPGSDPETVANMNGGFAPGAPRPSPAGPVAALIGEGGVRIVGPAYYYGQ